MPEDKKADKRIEAAVAFMRRVSESDSVNRANALYWRKFRYGEQWPAEIQNSRNLEQRPCITVNKTDVYCLHVENQQRQQRPRIKVDPTGGPATKRNADIIKGMIRHIESNRGGADMAYDGAFEGADTEGVGYFRILADYSREDSFEQELYMVPVDDPLTVYFDDNSIMPDGSDAEEVLIVCDMSKEAFKRSYPGKDYGANFVGSDYVAFADWMTEETIRVAEYYTIKHERAKLVRLSTGEIGWEDKLTPRMQAQIDDGTVAIAESRDSARKTVQWCKLSALDILDERDLPGKWIPVFPVYGRKAIIDGKVRRFGLIKNAIGPAQMANYWKCLSLDTPIPTPSGWTTIGDLEAGDTVFDEDGEPCAVIGTSPVHIKHQCFAVEFSDGTEIIADSEHLWRVEEGGKRLAKGREWSMKTVRTDQLDPERHRIPVPKPLVLPQVELPVDPYTLGVWLGDGNSRGSGITSGEADLEETREHLSALGHSLGPSHRHGHRAPTFSVYGLVKQLREIGVLKAKAIPQRYLRASETQRWALLQGLMDTDGSIGLNGQCNLTTTNPVLVEGFSELLASLGIKAHRMIRKDRDRTWADGTTTSEHSTEWQFSFSAHDDQPIFRLSRKLARLPSALKRHVRRTKRLRIREVRAVPSVPVKCIAVDTPTHLFLAGRSMVPTHNTGATESVALFTKAKWLIAEGQDEGHVEEWNRANVSTASAMRYKPTDVDGKPVPPPSRIQPEPPPVGMLSMAASVDNDLSSVLGIIEPAQRIQGNVSGKALQAERLQSDQNTYHLYDNLTRTIAFAGRYTLDVLKVYYSEPGRVVRIIGDDGKSRMETINQAHPQDPTQVINDITVGEYDVVMDTGPGYNTKRQEAVDSMMPLFEKNEKLMEQAGDIMFRNMDFPGAETIADRLAAANPLSQVDESSDVPPGAQTMIKGLKMQLEKMQGELQQATMLIKSRADLEGQKQAAETHRTLVKEAGATERNQDDNRAWQHDIAVKATTALSVAETNAVRELLKTSVNNRHDLTVLEKQHEHQEAEVDTAIRE